MRPRHWSTGQVAKLLGSTEPKVAETVRRGYVFPAPEVISGRRVWGIESVEQAALALGVSRELLFERLKEEETK